MKIYSTLKNKMSLLLIPAAILAMVSCSSYQYSGYEADGIYGESRPGIWEQESQPQNNEVRPNNKTSYYKNLFAQQSEMYGEILEGDIFTDVDSYSSADGYEGSYQDSNIAYVGGNAPWGQDPDSYTINIYNNGFYPGYYSPWNYGFAYGYPGYRGGFYNPYAWDPYWPGYWGSSMAFGYGSSWNIGFRFGFGYPYGYGYGYGGYYNPFYTYPYYYHHGGYYQNNDRFAFNEGRRNSRVSYSDGENRRLSSSRNTSYSRSIRDIRNSRTSDYGVSRTQSAANNNDRQIYTRTNRRTESARSYPYGTNSGNGSPSYQRSSQTENNRSYQPSTSRRSNSVRSTTTRSSNTSTRSSGATRSSSGSSRSSRGGRGGR